MRKKSQELAIIPEVKEPWYVRAWDASERSEWDQQVLEALHSSNPSTLASLVRQLQQEEPATVAPDPRPVRPTYVFQFASDIMQKYTPLIGRRV